MKLTLIRERVIHEATIGRLFYEGKAILYTLEDLDREVKVYGETCIPVGTYKITLTQSQRFKRILPLLNNVPNFEGIRIHPGNTKEDTHGCILVAKNWVVNAPRLYNSKAGFDFLFGMLTQANDKGEEIWIDIMNNPRGLIVDLP